MLVVYVVCAAVGAAVAAAWLKRRCPSRLIGLHAWAKHKPDAYDAHRYYRVTGRGFGTAFGDPPYDRACLRCGKIQLNLQKFLEAREGRVALREQRKKERMEAIDAAIERHKAGGDGTEAAGRVSLSAAETGALSRVEPS